jgi:acylphosphatase
LGSIRQIWIGTFVTVKALYILISGRVQGVGFRWFTERQAVERGVDGFVRNLTDGRVEVLAQAEGEVLEAFCDTLREGPAFSRPEELSLKTVPINPELRGFHIRF